MADTIIAGNQAKLIVTLTENDSAYLGLASADLVRVALFDMATKTIALEADDTSPNVILDDGGTGIVSWQLLSSETAVLPIGTYGLSIQSTTGTAVLEWIEDSSIKIIQQIIPNT